MGRLAVLLAAAALAAGCGGAKPPPEYAFLTDVQTQGDAVSFRFESAPRQVTVRYVPKESLAECGSGRAIPLAGRAYVSIHFSPAMTARVDGDTVTPTYTGPKRFTAPGPVLAAAKSCDFEADVGWVVGLARRLPYAVDRHDAAVTVSFG